MIPIETCASCGSPIDPAQQSYITDAEGKVYHEACYAQLTTTPAEEPPKRRRRKGGER